MNEEKIVELLKQEVEIATKVKDGWKTTEFIYIGIALLIGVASMIWIDHPFAKALAPVAAIMATAGYAKGRNTVKAKAIEVDKMKTSLKLLSAESVKKQP